MVDFLIFDNISGFFSLIFVINIILNEYTDKKDVTKLKKISQEYYELEAAIKNV